MFIKFKYIDNKHLLDCDGKEVTLQDCDHTITCLEDGCIFHGNEDVIENFHQEYNGKLFAQLFNGEISIFKWDNQESYIVVSDELLRRGFNFSI